MPPRRSLQESYAAMCAELGLPYDPNEPPPPPHAEILHEFLQDITRQASAIKDPRAREMALTFIQEGGLALNRKIMGEL